VDTWLEVIVKPTANTGLAAESVFFYGNLPGDVNNDSSATYKYTDANDEQTILQQSTIANSDLYDNYGLAAAIANLWDVNRDGQVDANDQFVARFYSFFPYDELDMINI